MKDLIDKNHELIQLGRKVLSTTYSGAGTHWVNPGMFQQFRAASLSFIENIYGNASTYFREFEASVDRRQPTYIEAGIGILKAIKSELEGGWLFKTQNLLRAEIFSDFLEMSEYLLEQGYKDAAAVIMGSVLEEHIKQLCEKYDIKTTEEKNEKAIQIKTDRLNADLYKGKAYDKLDNKNITAHLNLRNEAAHGDYDKYNEEQVKNMLSSIRELVARTRIV